jgi:predicted ester cyclase
MSIEQNKELVRRYLGALSGHDKPRALVDQFIADSDEELKQHIAATEAAFPRYEMLAEDMMAEGNKVVVRFTGHMTHQGDFMGLPPTGKTVSAPGIIIYRIENSKIAQHWIQMDSMSVMQQLGLMPQPYAT